MEGAERALTSVSRKLDASLSVEYTVNELINEATDVANLSRLFPGENYNFIATSELLIIGCRLESTLLNYLPSPAVTYSYWSRRLLLG